MLRGRLKVLSMQTGVSGTAFLTLMQVVRAGPVVLGEIGRIRHSKFHTKLVGRVQVGVIDTGISLGHEDLQRNVNKKCEDFVNGDHTCDEGKIKGPSKGARLTHLRLTIGICSLARHAF